MFKKGHGPERSRRGFTLIELLVVIFIIGILASLVIVNVSEARKSGRDAKRIANLKSIQGALEMYNQKTGGYPLTMNVANREWWGFCSGGTRSIVSQATNDDWIKGLTSGGYIATLPQDPKPNGTSGCYAYTSDGTDYKLIATSMETLCDDDDIGDIADPSDSCNPVSIQEIDDPIEIVEDATIAIYTFGAKNWK